MTSYARQLDRASADASGIAGFVGTHSKDATGGELISIAAEAHRHAATVISGTFERLTILLDQSGAELTAAATYYMHTDLTVAANLDRTLPGAIPCQPTTAVKQDLAAIACPPPPFIDMREVTRSSHSASRTEHPTKRSELDGLPPSSPARSPYEQRRSAAPTHRHSATPLTRSGRTTAIYPQTNAENWKQAPIAILPLPGSAGWVATSPI